MRITELAQLGRAFEPPSTFLRDRPDDPVVVRLSVELRDGRKIEVELPKGVRPKVDLTVDDIPGEAWLEFLSPRAFRTSENTVRIVIEADTRDGRAEDDGSLFRLSVNESA